MEYYAMPQYLTFQSTHPLRGATTVYVPPKKLAKISIHAPLAGCDADERANKAMAINFNPRTPCGVRPQSNAETERQEQFQSTHPLRGATRWNATTTTKQCAFQSTHPMRGATDFLLDIILGVTISIHAPARGATRSATTGAHTFRHFNPRTPCGVRPSLLPVRQRALPISIHAPLAGCDQRTRRNRKGKANFNPRTPCGVRRRRAAAAAVIT